MGGADVYCAFCGTRITQPFWTDGDYPYAYDSSLLTHNDTEWMNNGKVIGVNPNCSAPNKYVRRQRQVPYSDTSRVYISGQIRDQDYSYVEVDRGDDERQPAGEGEDYVRV